jgi:hypothetical protein
LELKYAKSGTIDVKELSESEYKKCEATTDKAMAKYTNAAGGAKKEQGQRMLRAGGLW